MLFCLYCCVGLSKLLDKSNVPLEDTLSRGADGDLMHDGRDSIVSRGDDDTSSMDIRRARRPRRSGPKEGEESLEASRSLQDLFSLVDRSKEIRTHGNFDKASPRRDLAVSVSGDDEFSNASAIRHAHVGLPVQVPPGPTAETSKRAVITEWKEDETEEVRHTTAIPPQHHGFYYAFSSKARSSLRSFAQLLHQMASSAAPAAVTGGAAAGGAAAGGGILALICCCCCPSHEEEPQPASPPARKSLKQPYMFVRSQGEGRGLVGDCPSFGRSVLRWVEADVCI